MAINVTSLEVLTSIVGLFDTFLLDCDGVLYNGDVAIDGAVAVTDMLRSKGMKIQQTVYSNAMILREKTHICD